MNRGLAEIRPRPRGLMTHTRAAAACICRVHVREHCISSMKYMVKKKIKKNGTRRERARNIKLRAPARNGINFSTLFFIFIHRADLLYSYDEMTILNRTLSSSFVITTTLSRARAIHQLYILINFYFNIQGIILNGFIPYPYESYHTTRESSYKGIPGIGSEISRISSISSLANEIPRSNITGEYQ